MLARKMLCTMVIPTVTKLEKEKNKKSHGCMNVFMGDKV
jgi:hypothetical protein